MPYLNLDIDFFGHPKTRRLIVLLGKGSEVLPLRLWAYCGKYHQEDGRLAGYAVEEIEGLCGWWGEKGKMVGAMKGVGLLDEDEDGLFVHQWLEHQGHIKAFKERAKQAALARWGVKPPADADVSSNATSIALSNAKDDAKQCSNRTVPDQPDQPNKSPPKSAGADLQGFVRFWQAWPSHFRKKGRSKCAKLWIRKSLEAQAEAIIASVEIHKRSPQWAKQGGEFIPGPEPWLNDEAWEVPSSALFGGANGASAPGVRRPTSRVVPS